ncbi:MAG: phosphomannose isomerase type II C-terminal cupin domain [Candidatus Marinimicrobia bacterium]|nr:phosphomannose isomerase type II C-terminal cupin domain [Candidatus Neomarinimicrobiota bacterium]
MSIHKEDRPWGFFEVLLDTSQCKVKKITVNPDCRLSLQSHEKRNEHWIVVEGSMRITTEDHVEDYPKNAHIYISHGTKHRMKNIGSVPASVIEIQTGEYFGEDDIIRYEDDYGRI